MANYVSTRVKELNIGISSYSASKTSLDVIGGAVISGVTTLASAGGITTTGGDFYIGGDLYVSDDIVLDEVTARNINATGIVTVGTTLDVDGILDVDGDTQVDDLNVAGVATFSALVDVNNRLDVVGGSNLDQLNVSGIATFRNGVNLLGLLHTNDGVNFTGDNYNLSWDKSNSALEFTDNAKATFGTASGGDLQIYSDGTFGIIKGNDKLKVTGISELNVTGVSTFASLIDANARIDVVGGINVDQLNVTGVSTFGDDVTFTAGGLNVTGIITATTLDISGNVDIDGNTTLDNLAVAEGAVIVGGANVDQLNLTGVSTFTGTIDANGALDVDGDTQLDDLNVAGVATFSSNVYVGSGITMYASTGIVSATAFYGDGSGLENTGAALAAASGSQRLVLTSLTTGTMITAATDSDLTYNGTTDTLNVGSAVTMGGSTGVISATSYHGNQVIGTPTGGFKTGAITITTTDATKDNINDLNNILGKLVPDAPDTINGVAIDLDNDTEYYLCAGFTPTNNTGGSAPDQTGTTAYVRNTDSTVTTDTLTEYGPGDSGTVTGFINAVGVGTTTLTEGVNNGTYDKLVISNNEDASNSTRNTGIASQFYEIYDVRLLNAVSPDGYNKAYLTQSSSTTGSTYWYEDPSTTGVPDVTFSSVTTPPGASDVVAYSSGIPHYTQSTSNQFSYVISVTNATGDMYYSNNNRLLSAESATTGFTKPDSYKLFNEMVSVGGTTGTHPPVQNFGLGAGVTCLATHSPNNIHATITSNHFHGWDCSTPYGSDNNEEASLSDAVNIMGTTADYTNNVDEDAIECTVGSLTGGSATRVKAGATGDNPTATYVSWTGGSAGSIDTYEAAVRGGDLRHDVTNYSTGYLPVGPNYSGNDASQYFQFQFIQASISEFQISYTGSLTGCWVCMPDNSTWTTSLSGTNGWANMFAAYKGSGVPTTAEPGCSSGGVMDTNGGTFTCVFGTESSSNDSNNRVLIRFKMTSGNSISDISLSDT